MEEWQKKIAGDRVIFRVTTQEGEYLEKLATLAGRNNSNTIRRALRLLAGEIGLELPEGVFSDKPGGNWLPKENRQPDPSPLAVG